MSRVKLSAFLGKVDYDKCFTDSSDNPQILLNQFSTNVKQRNSLQNLGDNYNRKKNTSIFRDIAQSVKKVEKNKIEEEGEILTNKLEGTTTLTRNQNSDSEMADEIDQEGGGRVRRGRKRKYTHRKKTVHAVKRRRKSHKKRKTYKKRKHIKKHRGNQSGGGRKKRKSSKKRRKHHYKRHNIFNQTE
jgi:hypothetical protein